ncbi:hypothetical protein E4U43_004666 [Claviceps pusilla]|uniref:Sfi1 spindle body domain-containing protein n=1 Tax=Claviceps pusilla TaxID=123648 RepID=A0A9P7NEZ8_9HYPO|nr:hypothetical protein E4U43_004666 [Claviceps pusilla]
MAGDVVRQNYDHQLRYITILHYIVSTAQEQFDKCPHPKPLPAAVLFKAYDVVLPTFGIDPDSDHHLSALIFRIGGESGTGSLLEKFHALLKRMDIFLEFDDDVTISDSPSPVPSPPCVETAGMPALQISKSPVADEVKDDAGPRVKPSTASSHVPDCTQSSRKTRQPDCHFTQESGQQLKKKLLEAAANTSHGEVRETFGLMENPVVRSNDGILAFQKSAMISVIDRWRKAMSGEIKTRVRDYISMVANDQGPRTSIKKANTGKDHFKFDPDRFRIETPFGAPAYDLSTAENNVLLLRAARARQIFLASRIFSRWADETAIRLEREAIARRHIVRFRCFNSWLQAPNATQPRIRRLKTLSAVQKLQNVVCRNAEQLKLMASSTAALRISKITFQILNLWFSSVLSQIFANRISRLVQVATIDRWLGQTGDCNQLRSNIAWLRGHIKYRRVLHTWANYRAKHRFQIISVHQITRRFEGLRWLGAWRNYTEIGFRAESCRQVFAEELSARRLDIWCLKARTEAFRGRRQHKFAMNYVQTWIAAVSRQSAVQASSEDFCRFKSAIKLASHLVAFTQTQQQLDVLGNRALWYIRATFLLERVLTGIRHKKQQIKAVVRRHLMLKYTQVSSKRRRRSFYTALTQWQSRARTSQATVSQCHTLHDNIYKRAICALWRKQAVKGATLHNLAVNLREQQFLNEWHKLAIANYQQQLSAAELWASEQQRQSLKAWARSTLQKGGQAHSADMVRGRHEQNHRNRAFQWWRHRASRSKHAEAFSGLQSPVLSVQINNSHKTAMKHLKWPLLSQLPSYKQEAMTPIQTPSRSTGVLFPSSHAPGLRFTDPVAERGSRLKKSRAQKFDLWKRGVAGRELMPGHGDASTTTPKTPVPIHVKPSRYVAALTSDKEQSLLVDSTRMMSFQGPDTQTSSFAASRSRNDQEDVELPVLASDRTTALHDFSLPGPNSQNSYARTGAVRMRRWQSGLRFAATTPLRDTENPP